jgi:hypothetical protein
VSDSGARGSEGGGLDQILGLALLQGNRFIREFLRSKQIRLGSTKEQFEANLREAIADGKLGRADIEEWLREVEGWGNQHLYAFDVPSAASNRLRHRKTMLARLDNAGLSKLLDADISLDPGEELALATIRHNEDGVSFLWVRADRALIRRKELDRYEELDGDEIEFHAYERRWSRVAARFEWRFDSGLAAVLINRSEARDYAAQRDLLLATVDTVIPARRGWQMIDISKVITELDSRGLGGQQGVNDAGVRVNSTVFQGAAANIRFRASAEAGSYHDDAAVREVRGAVDRSKFVGGAGDCYLTPTANAPNNARELHLRLYGQEQRTLLWGKMTLDEVWQILLDLKTYAAA